MSQKREAILKISQWTKTQEKPQFNFITDSSVMRIKDSAIFHQGKSYEIYESDFVFFEILTLNPNRIHINYKIVRLDGSMSVRGCEINDLKYTFEFML